MSITTTSPLVQSITMEQLEADPYPILRTLREQEPVAWVPAIESWLVTSWDDCERIGAEVETFVSSFPNDEVPPFLERALGVPNVLFTDGPEHKDQRRGIDARLEARAVLEYIQPLVQPIARAHVQKIRAQGRAELTSEYFEPVSVEALRHVMGLNEHVDTPTLVRWFHLLIEGTTNFMDDPEVNARIDVVNSEITAVLSPVLAEKRANPGEDMLSHMIHRGREGGEPRSDEEIIGSVKVILAGGMQEPGHAAASTMLGLLQNPDQLADVIEDPELIPLAVHEGLRWIAPIGLTQRWAVSDQRFGDVVIPAGQLIQIALSSANRDESRFINPDAFDIHRSRKPNQAFGHGEHFCAGHFFGRQVEYIMFTELLAELPDLRLDPEQAAELFGFFFRSPKTLPVVWEV